MSQTRKQRILGDVKKKRRQRAVISITLVVVIIGIVVTAVALLPRSGNPFPFDCLGYEPVTLHVHPWLRINIVGQSVTIPARVGITSCFEPVHTHDASGILHVEASDVNSQYTLGDFFTIWKDTYSTVIINGTPHPIVFDNTHILGFNASSVNHVTLTVDGTNSTSSNYASLGLKMYDYCTAADTGPPCSPTAVTDPGYGGNAYPYGTHHTIVINYGP